jgi:hypothetical protein
MFRLKKGQLEFTNDATVKRDWLEARGRLWVAWPGQYRTDVFEVDRTTAKAALA